MPGDALAVTATALARVLDVDPAVLRSDTPLTDIGCDPVAVLAFLDVLVEDHGLVPDTTDDQVDAAIVGAATVGDLARIVDAVQ